MIREVKRTPRGKQKSKTASKGGKEVKEKGTNSMMESRARDRIVQTSEGYVVSIIFTFFIFFFPS